MANTYSFDLFDGFGVRSAGGSQVTQSGAYYGILVHPGLLEGCSYDDSSNGSNSAYAFMCAIMVR
jgi:hypothetical protein